MTLPADGDAILGARLRLIRELRADRGHTAGGGHSRESRGSDRLSMTLSDAASIATIVSAGVILAAFVVASLSAKWARDSAVAGKEAVEEGLEPARRRRNPST